MARREDDRDRDRDDDRDRDRGRDRDDDRDSGSKKGKSDTGKSIEVKLTDVRLSFASVFKKKSFGDDDSNPRYAATFLMDKRKQADLIRKCEDAIDDAKYAKWGDKQPSLRDDKLALRDGDDENYDGYEDMMYVAARSERRPQVLDRDRTPLTEDDGRPYSGCFVNAIVRFWAQDNKWGKRVNASLEGVQFVKDGEAFGPAPLDDDAFDDLGRDRDSDRDRGRSREGDRDRGRSRDDDRGSRSRDRGGDRERSSRDDDRGSRSRDDDRGSRSRDDDRGSRSRDDDRPRSSGSDFDENNDRDRPRRGRDDDRGSRDRDGDRGSRDRDGDRSRSNRRELV
jgi:hypothetical protein